MNEHLGGTNEQSSFVSDFHVDSGTVRCVGADRHASRALGVLARCVAALPEAIGRWRQRRPAVPAAAPRPAWRCMPQGLSGPRNVGRSCSRVGCSSGSWTVARMGSALNRHLTAPDAVFLPSGAVFVRSTPPLKPKASAPTTVPTPRIYEPNGMESERVSGSGGSARCPARCS
jgi:hypothetical protein